MKVDLRSSGRGVDEEPWLSSQSRSQRSGARQTHLVHRSGGVSRIADIRGGHGATLVGCVYFVSPITSEGLNVHPMATTSSPSEDTPAQVPEPSENSGSPEPSHTPGSVKKPSREVLSSSGLLGRIRSARSALDRGIDWAERRRQADRDFQLHWESDSGEDVATKPTTPPVSTTHVRVAPSVSFPETVTTRSTIVDSLPS